MIKIESVGGLFDGVLGPSPWYLNSNTPAVAGFRWQRTDDISPAAGKTLLVGPQGPVAILNFYNYVMVVDESTLLIWHQVRHSSSESLRSSPIRMLVIEPNLLMPFKDDLNSLYKMMNAQNEYIALGGDVSAEINLATTNTTDELKARFPAALQSIKELLILCHSSGIATQVDSANLALMMVHPSRSEYRLYPQDWFNGGGIDYGYQWVTRVVRNPQTGYIHGEGVRIRPFILEDSLRGLRRV